MFARSARADTYGPRTHECAAPTNSATGSDDRTHTADAAVGTD